MATASASHDVDNVRARVRMYLLVLLVIDVFAYVSDGATLLFTDEPVPQLQLHYAILRWGCTAVMVGGWSFAYFARPSARTLVVIEAALTLALVLVYSLLGDNFLRDVMPEYGPAFSLLGVLMLLSVRAALVPSATSRTAVIGSVSVTCWIALTYDVLFSLAPVVREGLLFMAVAIVLATSVTSRVIYGLRRQVRDAMRLGQYQLGRKLGEGGMGVVYEATHLMLRRPTAVKLLPIAKAGEQTIARFEREVRQTSRLEHPNSVYIYDYGRTPDGQFYYAMEYLDGITLDRLVELDGPIGADRAVHILLQAARALAEAHHLGLIHRDLKPANVMLCERAQVPDTVKVLDFGLVKAIDEPEIDGNITQANHIVGTPHYLSPEAIASPEAAGPASDIYALGALGFFLVTGREVFPGSSVIEVCSQHLHTTPERPSAVRGEPLDPGFEALILRCLAKDPSERPALAAELEALDLAAWTVDDATLWWRTHLDRAARPPPKPSTPSQLAVDVHGRA